MFGDIYKNKKVLVTGNTGFKGSWLSAWLLKLGAEVYGYSIDIPTEPSHFNELGIEKEINQEYGDVRDFNHLKKYIININPDIIFHMAAQPIVRRSYSDPLYTIETNVLGVANVLEATRHVESVKSVVVITSDKCYENVEWIYGYREIDRVGGEDPYSASKGAAEIIASSYMRSFFKDERVYVATVRAGNVIGGGDWAKDRLIPDAMKAWANNEKLIIRSPKATRPWQHVLEPLSGYLLVGKELFNKNKSCKSQAFNFGPDATINKTVEDVLVEMSKSWKNVKWEVEKNKNKLSEAGLLKLNCDKAHNYLQWFPTLDFNKTIEFTVKWYEMYYSFSKNKDVKEYTMNQIEDYISYAQKKDLTWAK